MSTRRTEDWSADPDEEEGIAGDRYARTALGDLIVSQARWWKSDFDMLIKMCLLFLYICMLLTSIAFLVPLTLDAIVNAIYLFAFPFGYTAGGLVLLALSVIDSFNVGLSYTGRDAAGHPIVVSYRDRSMNILLSGILALVNAIIGTLFAIWFGRHSDLDEPSEFAIFGQGVAQYYALAAVGAATYLLTPIVAVLVVYGNVRYEMGVHLVSSVVMRIKRMTIDELFE